MTWGQWEEPIASLAARSKVPLMTGHRGRNVVFRIILWTGVAVMVAAATAGWFLAVLLLPGASANAPEFDEGRSMVGLWRDRQRMIHWLGHWGHDDGLLAGKFGDRSLLEPLVDSMISGEGISCAGGHREAGLAMLTNHLCPPTEDLAFWWRNWRTEHRHESQEEWLRLGFAIAGVEMSLPPSPNDWPGLLLLLGESVAEVDESENAHDFPSSALSYNAFRWLRDSGFDPVNYLLDHPEPVSDQEGAGLRAFRKWEEWFRGPVPGRLAFASKDWGWHISKDHMPWGLTSQGRASIWSVLAAVFLVGAGLVVSSRRVLRGLQLGGEA